MACPSAAAVKVRSTSTSSSSSSTPAREATLCPQQTPFLHHAATCYTPRLPAHRNPAAHTPRSLLTCHQAKDDGKRQRTGAVQRQVANQAAQRLKEAREGAPEEGLRGGQWRAGTGRLSE